MKPKKKKPKNLPTTITIATATAKNKPPKINTFPSLREERRNEQQTSDPDVCPIQFLLRYLSFSLSLALYLKIIRIHSGYISISLPVFLVTRSALCSSSVSFFNLASLFRVFLSRQTLALAPYSLTVFPSQSNSVDQKERTVFFICLCVIAFSPP